MDIGDNVITTFWEERLWGRWYSYTFPDRAGYGFDDWLDYHSNVIEWIKENIPGYEKHSRWKFIGDSSLFCFRYERDYLLFVLRWG
jgi:hypothetical protein